MVERRAQRWRCTGLNGLDANGFVRDEIKSE